MQHLICSVLITYVAIIRMPSYRTTLFWLLYILERCNNILKYCYIAIFSAAIQYNTADLEYRYIANCNILLNIASASDNLNAKLTKLN